MKKILSLLFVAAAITGATAADLTIDAKFDLSGKDLAGSYFSFKSAIVSVEKDQVDVVTGASKAEATDKWNYLRPDVKGKNTLPGAFNHLLKWGVSPATQYEADLPFATTNADGSITIQFVHRGTALKLTTDQSGKFTLPVGDYKTRKIGLIDAKGVNVIHPDFSSDATVAGVDWAKVWDASIADGQVINNVAAQKTGKIVEDKAASTIYQWTGAVQVTLEGTVVSVKGELNAEIVK